MNILEKIYDLYYRKVFLKINSSSLKAKLGKDIFKGSFIAILIGYLILIFLDCYIHKYSLYETLITSLIYFIIIIIILIFMDYYLMKSIKKNILDRFNQITNEMDDIKKGNISKRISIKSNDAIDKLSYFTNTLLDELEKFVEYEKKYSFLDPLTSCYNRRALDVNFKRLISQINRDKTKFALILIDLDDFKKINDTYGHTIGDQVLIEFSKFIQNIIRQHDFITRIGGDEFLIILDKTNKQNTNKLLKRLKQNIPYQLKKNIKEISKDITISCGFVLSNKYNIEDKDLLNKMIKDADKLLYKAKNNGRNSIIG